jgi:hypothetical protein
VISKQNEGTHQLKTSASTSDSVQLSSLSPNNQNPLYSHQGNQDISLHNIFIHKAHSTTSSRVLAKRDNFGESLPMV